MRDGREVVYAEGKKVKPVCALLQKNGTRVWFNGRTSAFQAEDAGSIPATRSNFACSKECLEDLFK